MLAANRDEHMKRPWDPPAAYWPDQADVIAGRDRTAGGTWMGVNRAGVVAAILNRAGTLGPVLGKRSRGELPLLALRHPTARAAADAITGVDAGEWRDFNMVIAYDPNDLHSPRVARHLPRLRAALPRGPDDWQSWRAILSDRSGAVGEQINVAPRGDFATVCSAFVCIPAAGKLTWQFAPGPPHRADFGIVDTV
jgi:hypothetical protein